LYMKHVYVSVQCSLYNCVSNLYVSFHPTLNINPSPTRRSSDLRQQQGRPGLDDDDVDRSRADRHRPRLREAVQGHQRHLEDEVEDRKSTRLNSSHVEI